MDRLGKPHSLKSVLNWSLRPLDAWPSDLPRGMGGDWDGWQSMPDEQGHWASERRMVVASCLKQQYSDAHLALPPTFGALESDQCRIVTVGHQLVLGGGPAFFHHKILSAIRVARQLEAKWSRPVVPVFWMASEDHDWLEVASVEGETLTHQWDLDDRETPWPVGLRALGGLTDWLNRWVLDGISQAHAEGMQQDLRDAIEANESLVGLMRRWIHRWYGDEGLLVLDPMDAELKSIAAPLWRAEFEGSGVASVLMGTSQFQGPAHVRENNLFWLDDNQGRVGVVRATECEGWLAGALTLNGEQTPWELWLNENACQCSPGVLLRPLYQEWLLQSAAVVVGPGEWGYWNQLPAVFERHGLAFPSLRLRDHGLVLDRDFHQMDWDWVQGWPNQEAWDQHVLDRWMEEWADPIRNLNEAMEAWKHASSQLALAVAKNSDGFTGAMQASIDKTRKQWMKKLRRSLKQSRPEDWSRAQKALSSMIRAGKPQDRWANWHVLGGDQVEEWTKAWLNPEVGLKASVWWFEHNSSAEQ